MSKLKVTKEIDWIYTTPEGVRGNHSVNCSIRAAYMKSSALVPKSSNASSYIPVSL
jgi:hypothetical protein